MLTGFATPEGTARFADRFSAEQAAGFYRGAQGFSVSNIGIGTYLGEMDDATDRRYVDAVLAALEMGVNFVDTSLNYRHQRSERCIGQALRTAVHSGPVRRDEIVISTKAGFLVPGAIPAGIGAEDIAGGMHSIAPLFLADQLSRSRKNLDMECIDVFYLHNPETQLGFVSKDAFYKRIREAFQFLESAAGQGGIRFFGTATWDGYRRPAGSKEALSLDRLSEIAREIGGESHHFRFIQLPCNLSMTEAFDVRTGGESILDTARRLGITAVASASLLQARLARNLPAEIRENLSADAQTDAQCAIQFTRSVPGITVALVGMSNVKHVHENLTLAKVRPRTATPHSA
jgi:aryl-alcohol dehydrogenase-like predicted oxidoreductase